MIGGNDVRQTPQAAVVLQAGNRRENRTLAANGDWIPLRIETVYRPEHAALCQSRHGDRFDLTGTNLSEARRYGGKHDLHFSTHEADERWRTAFVRHVLHADTGE